MEITEIQDFFGALSCVSFFFLANYPHFKFFFATNDHLPHEDKSAYFNFNMVWESLVRQKNLE